MNIIAWVLLGLIIGIIVHSFDDAQTNKKITPALLVGVSGALLGGFLAEILFDLRLRTFNLSSFLIAFTSSLLMLYVGRSLRKV